MARIKNKLIVVILIVLILNMGMSNAEGSALPFFETKAEKLFDYEIDKRLLLSDVEMKSAFDLVMPINLITLTTPSDVFLGSDFNLQVRFENEGDDLNHGTTGYGPFVDLVIPRGDGTNAISPPSGGYSASYNTENLDVVVNTFPDDVSGIGCVNHPWSIDEDGFFTQVCGASGDDLLSIRLPFGSVTSSQPAVSISVPLHLEAEADLTTPQLIRGRGGYEYGATAMIDFCCTTPKDTTIVSSSSDVLTWPSESVNPTLISLSKTSTDADTASGKNYPAQYNIQIQTADSQEFTDFTIVDDLPYNIVFLGNVSVSPASALSVLDAIYYDDDTTDGVAPIVIGTGVALPDNGAKSNSQLVFDFSDTNVLTGDINITFDYYIPEFDATTASTTNLTVNNVASLTSGIWYPLSDPLNPAAPVNLVDQALLPGAGSVTTEGEILTMSKGVYDIDAGSSSETEPGDVLRYTISFELSDYYGIGDVVINDLLPDGVRYYENSALGQVPSFSLNRNSSVEVYPMSAANIDWTCNYSTALLTDTYCDAVSGLNNGTTSIAFRISDQIYDLTVDPTPADGNDDEKVFASQFLGGDVQISDPHTYRSDTTGSLTFYAKVEDHYTDSYSQEQIKMGDEFTNSADIDSYLLESDSCLTIPCTIRYDLPVTTSASTTNEVPYGSTSKTIVGYKDSLCNASTYAACSDVEISASDLVLYRITYTVPTGDFYDLSFTDYLPLPIFHADDPDATGSSVGLGAWNYSADINDLFLTGGTWTYGPNHSADYAATNPPVLSISDQTHENTVKFDLGNYDAIDNQERVIDIVISVRVTSDKFADQMKLRNSILQQDSNSTTYNPEAVVNADLTLTEPVLIGSKTIVATDSSNATATTEPSDPLAFYPPGSTGVPWYDETTNGAFVISSDFLGSDNSAIDSSFGNLDGGDTIRFAILIQNVGSGVNGAFDIVLQDEKPNGLIIPPGGINLQVTRGDGVNLNSMLNPLGTSFDETDLFDQGIELLDPGQLAPTDALYGQGGACQGHDSTSGTNIILITYDLMIDPALPAGTELVNNGKIVNYSGEEGGENYVEEPEADDDSTTLREPTIEKTIVSTEIETSPTNTTNTGNEATIGELITYRVEVTMPESSSDNMVLRDTLDNGLVFVSLDTSSFGLFDSNDVALASGVIVDDSDPLNIVDISLPSTVVSNSGRTLTWDFGRITNLNNDNSVDEKFVFEYTVMVTDYTGNNRGNYRNNAIVMTWDLEDGSSESSDVERAPNVRIVEPTLLINKTVTPSTAQAGTPISYSIVINHESNSNNTDAYDVTFSDPIPACTSGESIIVIDETDAGTIAAAFDVVDSAGVVDKTLFELVGSNATGWTLKTIDGSSFDFLYDTSRTITISLDGTVSYCVNPEFTYPNTATVNWTSMDGEITNRDYDSGTAGVDRERSYTTDSSVTTGVVTVEKPALTKSIYSTSDPDSASGDLALGEIVTYQLAFTIPQGTSTSATVQDVIPVGLEYIANSTTLSIDSDVAMSIDADLNGANGIGLVNPGQSVLDATDVNGTSFVTVTGSAATGQYVSVYIGDLVNNDEPVSGTTTADETIIVRFNAIVLDTDSTNTIGAVKENDFELIVSGNTYDSNDISSRIVEPDLDIEKTNALVSTNCVDLNDGSGTSFNNCIGATIGYTVMITNPYFESDGTTRTFSSVGWDTVITDVIPSGLTLNSATLSAAMVDNSSGSEVRTTVGTVGSGWVLDYTAPTITLTAEAGQRFDVSDTTWYEITYQAVIDDNASDIGATPVVDNVPLPGDVLTNTVKVDWTNQDGVVVGEKTYTESTNSSVTVENGELVIDKYDATFEITGSASTLEPGAKIYYGIRFQNMGNVPTKFTLSENLPANTAYDAALTDTTNGVADSWTLNSTTGEYEAIPVTTAGVGLLGEAGATDAGSGDATDRGVWYFVVTINTPLPAGVNQITNVATIFIDETSGGPEPKPGDNQDQIQLNAVGEPNLSITKTNNKDTTTLGDTLTYTITYQNTGGQNATGVVLTETVPAGTTWFDDPAVTTDDGWVCDSVGAAGEDCVWNVGALAAHPTDVHTVTFAVVVDSITSVTFIDNTVSIEDDGTNNTSVGSPPQSDSDSDQDILIQGMDKHITSISEPAASTFDPNGNDVAIGATLVYEVSIDIPSTSGTDDIVVPNFVMTDVLDEGLAFLGCGDGSGADAVTASGNLTTSIGAFVDLCDRATELNPTSTAGTSPTVDAYPIGNLEALNQGRMLTFDFGTITNSNDSSVTQTITIVYRAVVLNDASVVVNSGERNNHVDVTWDDVSSSLTSEAESVEIVEPFLNIEKTASQKIVPVGGNVQFTLRIFHEAASTTSAFDVNVFDTLPLNLEYVTGSENHESGEAPDSIVYDPATRTLTISYDDWDPSVNIDSEISFVTTVNYYSSGRIVNDANVEWTSLPGDLESVQQSPFNTLSNERYYDPLDAVNLYGATSSFAIEPPTLLPETGFVPNQISSLSSQPDSKVYYDTGAMILEIPSLGVKANIIGIPEFQNTWDVSWLQNNVGYLTGTAFPTQAGKTLLAGHVVNAQGVPSVFAELKNLHWGDEFYIYANGLKYVYQVQSNEQIKADDLNIYDSSAYDEVSLVTCQGFNEETGLYDWRISVTGVLIHLEK